jgi:hypothetical protein
VSRLNLLPIALLAASAAAGAIHDPAFDDIPFQKWVEAGDTSPLKWKLKVGQAQLDPNQRLLGQVELEFDGADLESRRGKGEFLVFVQVEDSGGNVYQDHGRVDLKPIQEGFRKFNLTYTQQAFFTPGQYRVSAVVVQKDTSDHWGRKLAVAVPALKSDPLPGIWSDLPPLELVPQLQPPDTYWVPSLKGKLKPPAGAARPLDVHILLNLTASPRYAGRLDIQQRNLGVLVPAMRAITELLPAGSRVNVDLLDLVRHRVVYRQNDVGPVDFARMREGLQPEPGKIDVSSLAHGNAQAGYFVSQVSKHLAPGRVVIVLSASIDLELGDGRIRIEDALPPSAKVFYFCFAPPPSAPPAMRTNWPPHARVPGMRMGRPGRVAALSGPDQLAGTLKPLDPAVYTFTTPLQLRKALATMLQAVQ